MNGLINEDLARVHAAALLTEATAYHRGRRLASAQRLSRRSERAAQRVSRRAAHAARRARLAVARAL